MDIHSYVVHKRSYKTFWKINVGVFVKRLLTHWRTIKHDIDEFINEE